MGCTSSKHAALDDDSVNLLGARSEHEPKVDFFVSFLFTVLSGPEKTCCLIACFVLPCICTVLQN